MKYWMVLTTCLTFLNFSYSQTYEAGLFVGGANYIGDVGKTIYIAPSDLAIGAIFKWNRSARHSFRASFTWAEITGDDLASDTGGRNQRGYSFENSIKELSLGLEYTFWEYDLHSGEPQFAPYLYTGLTYFNYDALSLSNGEIEKYDSAWALAIPMVLGVKFNLTQKLSLGMEVGVRYTFTDDLDGSNPVKDRENNPALQFGNPESDDWYVFSGITLTYTFGRMPCYCAF